MLLILLMCAGVYLAFILFIISGLFKHSILPISSSNELPSISVVIAARNEENHLPDLIQDLMNQEYPLDKLEAIIVDDRSTDLTPAILKEAADNYAFIKTIRIKEPSQEMTPKKHAMTKGIEAAKGEVIVSTDADCRVGKLWVSSMAYSVINHDCISIGFSKISGDTFFEQYQEVDFLGIITANAGAGGWNQFWSGTGQNLAYYKNDFIAIDGFKPVKNKISGDDMYLVQSISKLKRGFIHIDPNSFTTTTGMNSVKEFLNQRIRWSSNSKANAGQNPLFFGFLITAFLYNSFILLSMISGSPWLVSFGFKFILDGLVILLGCKLFETKPNPLAYCIWAMIQPLYIPAMGILGVQEKFTWKT